MDDPGLALLAPTFPADPCPTRHRLRETAPVLRGDALQRSIITGYDECLATLRSPDTGIGRDQFLAEMGQGSAAGVPSTTSHADSPATTPPQHHRLRTTVQGAFSGQRLDRRHGYISDLVRGLLPAADAPGPVDLLAQRTHPRPSPVIGELLGLPDEERAAFDGWTRALAPLIGPAPSPADVAAGTAAAEAEWTYLAEWADRRARAEPPEDVTSGLLAARRPGSSRPTS